MVILFSKVVNQVQFNISTIKIPNSENVTLKNSETINSNQCIIPASKSKELYHVEDTQRNIISALNTVKILLKYYICLIIILYDK
jgi:hypothetical protein